MFADGGPGGVMQEGMGKPTVKRARRESEIFGRFWNVATCAPHGLDHSARPRMRIKDAKGPKFRAQNAPLLSMMESARSYTLNVDLSPA